MTVRTLRGLEPGDSGVPRRTGGQISGAVFRGRGITRVRVGVEAPGPFAHLSHLLPAFGKKAVAGRPQTDVRVHGEVLGGLPRGQVDLRPG